MVTAEVPFDVRSPVCPFFFSQVEIQDERSQHQNKAKALRVLAARVQDNVDRQRARERRDTVAGVSSGWDPFSGKSSLCSRQAGRKIGGEYDMLLSSFSSSSFPFHGADS